MPPMHDPTESRDRSADRRWSILAELRDWWDEIHASAIFLTRLPIRWSGEMPPDLAARSLRAGPVVGAVIGLAAGGLYVLPAWAGVPALAAALIAVAGQMLLTGALHEDGLADLADGLGGGDSRDSKLAIMRDSRIGSFGALALVVAILARVVALAAIPHGWEAVAALIAAGAVSRAGWTVLMAFLPPARADGLAASHGQQPADRLIAALATAALIAVIVLPVGHALLALSVAALTLAGLGLLVIRQIGGYTGDVLGAAQQGMEIAVLVAVAALV